MSQRMNEVFYPEEILNMSPTMSEMLYPNRFILTMCQAMTQLFYPVEIPTLCQR